MDINVYLGKFGQEKKIFSIPLNTPIPQKGDMVYYHDEVYKVLYHMLDISHGEDAIFVRMAVEEDY